MEHNSKMEKRFDVASFELIKYYQSLSDPNVPKERKVDPHFNPKALEEIDECEICRHRFLKPKFFEQGTFIFQFCFKYKAPTKFRTPRLKLTSEEI